jgi:hypothetical protein
VSSCSGGLLCWWGRFYSASSSVPPAAEGYFAGGLVYSASSSGPPAAEGFFAAVGRFYSASSSVPPVAEGFFAAVGWFILLAVLVLLQRRVTLPRWVGLLC